tara:strand:+ start:419 stop:1141 length:723 start_codon:yes stop_codon:yes gene_type:complete
MRNIICLLTYQPSIVWLDFLSKFNHYDVVVIVDDILFDLSILKEKYASIIFFQIKDDICEKAGYKNSSTAMEHKPVIAWDKAFYYFITQYPQDKIKQIWFMEDDVYFYDENVLVNLDNNHRSADLLCKKYKKYNEPKHKWHWDKIDIKFSAPLYESMICVCRLSLKMLNKIQIYVNKYKTLTFIEALLPTLCLKKKLNFKSNRKFNSIIWRKKYTKEKIDKISFFHPVKECNLHYEFRNI